MLAVPVSSPELPAALQGYHTKDVNRWPCHSRGQLGSTAQANQHCQSGHLRIKWAELAVLLCYCAPDCWLSQKASRDFLKSYDLRPFILGENHLGLTARIFQA